MQPRFPGRGQRYNSNALLKLVRCMNALLSGSNFLSPQTHAPPTNAFANITNGLFTRFSHQAQSGLSLSRPRLNAICGGRTVSLSLSVWQKELTLAVSRPGGRGGFFSRHRHSDRLAVGKHVAFFPGEIKRWCKNGRINFPLHVAGAKAEEPFALLLDIDVLVGRIQYV
jgi:hypothetical protein